MSKVELVASGYEWQCPECGVVGYESIVPADGHVVCAQCGGVFPIEKAHHRSGTGAMRPGQGVIRQEALPLEPPSSNES